MHFAEDEDMEKHRITTNSDRIALEKEQKNGENFYAIDCETNGLRFNEPLQIGVVLFEDGEEKEHLNIFCKSEKESTEEALELHQLSKQALKNLKAKRFNKTRAQELA